MTVHHRLHPLSRRSRTAAVFGAAALTVAVTLGTAVGAASADTVLTPPIDVGTVNVTGTAAFGVAITPNGQYAYVTNYGGNTLSVIDTSNNDVIATVTGTDINQPSTVAITPDGKHVYVTNQWGRDTVSVIDTALGDAPNTVTANVPVGTNPNGIAITPDGKYAYVANVGSSTVSVINTTTDPPAVIATVTDTIYAPRDVAITPDGQRVYVTNGNGTASVIDTALNALGVPANTVIGTVPVGTTPIGIAITPDGKYAYVANYNSSTVSVVKISDNTVTTVTDTANTFNNPNKVAITPDGQRAYVTNSNYQYGGQTVSVIDTTTNTVINALAVGRGPTGVAITPDGNHAYIANMGDDTVSVIKIEQAPTLTGNPPPAVVGQPYDYAFTIIGRPAPTVTVAPNSTLPTGLALSPAGALTGTPTTSGRFEFTITATNNIGEPVTLPVTLEIADAPTSSGSLGSLENFGTFGS